MGRLCRVKANKAWKANEAKLGELSDVSNMHDVKTFSLASMGEAVEMDKTRQFFMMINSLEKKAQHSETRRAAISGGDPAALARAVERSDTFVDGALAYDGRLAKRATWTRAEDGIFADVGLVASGDDSPCYTMTRGRLQDFASAGAPVNVVISTDSSKPTNLAAFVAVVRIVQQFRPVNVYWQGAWMADDGREAGYVFHVPLVQNDMDFARVQFVLTSVYRDSLSFSVAHVQAVQRDKTRMRGLGRPATRSYMRGALFVGPDGVQATAEGVATTAASWLGLESVCWSNVASEELAEVALQKLPPVYAEYKDTRTQADKDRQEKRWNEERETRDRARQIEAAARLAAVSE